MTLRLSQIRRSLRACADPMQARILRGFFKTGKGEYAAGDVFLGITVPRLRRMAREYRGVPLAQVRALLVSRFHEERLLALLILIFKFESGCAADRRRIYDLYLKHTAYINNWDLVDLSAPRIVGAFLSGKTKEELFRLASSGGLWEKRIAVVATHHFIRNNSFKTTLGIARIFLSEKEDLIQKAAGWMLREVGKRDNAVLKDFLRKTCAVMPRTMLRYSIERFPERERQKYLRGRVRRRGGILAKAGSKKGG